MDAVHENRLLSRWAELLPGHPDRLGGVHQADAELVPLGDGRLLALKVDAVVEEIAAGLYSPRTAGRIAVLATLSDLAAVGADPIGLLLSVTLPPGDPEPLQVEVAAGVREACEAAGVFVLGGDTNDGPALAITVAAAATVPAASVLTRMGLAPGHVLWSAGPLGLGGALAAAKLLKAPGFGEDDYRPVPRLATGRALRGVASCAMDTSDGLLATLDQLARLNDCAIRLEPPLARLLHPKAEAVRLAVGLPAFPFLGAHHGEFELVFATPPGVAPPAGSLRLGVAVEGDGVFVGDRPVHAAALRNLLQDLGGDALAYAVRLAGMDLG